MSANAPDANDTSVREFNRFFVDRLRPLIEEVTRRRRGALKRSLLVAVALFAAFMILVYAFFSPYNDILGEHRISYWPLMVLLPATMGVIGFSMVYILSLRTVVRDFRNAVIGRMAEFIDPGIVHEPERAVPDADVRDSLLFGEAEKAVAGGDHFRGRADAARFEFSDLRVGDAGGKGKKFRRGGLFFIADFDRRFRAPLISLPASAPASLSAAGQALRDRGLLSSNELVRLDDAAADRQTLVPAGEEAMAAVLPPASFLERVERLRKQRKVEVAFSCLAGRLCVAVLTEGDEAAGVLDGFDFGNYREFCRDATLCLELTREVLDQAGVWA